MKIFSQFNKGNLFDFAEEMKTRYIYIFFFFRYTRQIVKMDSKKIYILSF